MIKGNNNKLVCCAELPFDLEHDRSAGQELTPRRDGCTSRLSSADSSYEDVSPGYLLCRVMEENASKAEIKDV